MKALITGAGGFVGKYLSNYLESEGDQVITPDRKELDIEDFSSVRTALSKSLPEVIYHLAGWAFVPDCDRDFKGALSANVYGTENVLQAARETASKPKIILVSTGDLYGKVAPANLPCDERLEVNPANNYSLTKLFAEKLARRAQEIYAQEIVILRPFNHIGPGQSIKFAIASFAHQIAQIKAGKIKPEITVGNLDAKRDLTDVRDIVRGYRLAAIQGSGTYNLCTGKSVSIKQALDILLNISGLDVKISVDPERLRPSEIKETRGNAEKAYKELGWKAEIPLSQSLSDCIEYFLR